MNYAQIRGTGSYLPANIMTNQDWEKLVDTSDDWIVERTGIKQRHVAAEDESASSMGHQAALQALTAANLNPDQLDMIIVGTCTPDQFFPSTACLIQQKLGIERNIIAFDVSAACAGFIYALSVAEQFIKTGVIKHALVIGSEVMSRSVDWNDRSTCILFGDGAGAVVLSAGDKPGIISSHLHAQGKHKDLLFFPNLQGAPAQGDNPHLQMKGSEVFKLAVRAMGDVVEEAVAANGLAKQHIDWLVPHQANLRIISATAKKLKMPMEQVIVTVDQHGNTSSASIPLALDTGIRDGRIKQGDTVLFEGFGGGMAWGAVLAQI